MLAASQAIEIFCPETMLDTVPMVIDGPTVMEDIKIVEEKIPIPEPKKKASPFLSLVTRIGDKLQLVNSDYHEENLKESM